MSETKKWTETVDQGEMYCELSMFTEEFKDFGFYVPQGKTLAALVTQFNKTTENKGEETVLALANTSVEARFRNRCKQKLKSLKPEEIAALIAADKTLLVSVEDAMLYAPGTREGGDSIESLMRARKKSINAAVEAKAEGRVEDYQILVRKSAEIDRELQDALAKQLASLVA